MIGILATTQNCKKKHYIIQVIFIQQCMKEEVKLEAKLGWVCHGDE
jgi:hypothetical protein